MSSVYQSSQFVSVSASASHWRDAAQEIVQQLQNDHVEIDKFNFGWVYVSDPLSADLEHIHTLFRSVLGIENWIGAAGLGVCATGEEYFESPAISVMLGSFDKRSFCIFGPDQGGVPDWLRDNDPMLGVVHANILAQDHICDEMKALRQRSGGFLVGGLASSTHSPSLVANDVFAGGLCGVLFSQEMAVSTTLSQGCSPIGNLHTITHGYDHCIQEIDGKPALEVFESDLRGFVSRKVDKDPALFLLEHGPLDHGEVPQEFKDYFDGEVHVAFPVSETDQPDYTVREITGLDTEDEVIEVSQNISIGERILFVQRSDETLQSDLAQRVVELRKRVERETGGFNPKGALYMTCLARGFHNFDNDKNSELALIRDIIGDVPLTGFYAAGEVSNARLYRYTGVLTLFL